MVWDGMVTVGPGLKEPCDVKRVGSDIMTTWAEIKASQLQIVFTPCAVAMQCKIKPTLEVSRSIFTLEF